MRRAAGSTAKRPGTGTKAGRTTRQPPGRAAPDAAAALVDDLVAANRILFRHGVVDAFGHVSVRHDRRPDRFLLARNLAPALVEADDIFEFDLDGERVGTDDRPVYLERFIHSEIYRAMPAVHAVVHSHSPAVVPFGAVRDARLQALWHMSGFLGQEVPVFEIRDAAGPDTDLLIRTPALGAALARTLSGHPVVLMRGHGATVIGSDVRQAVYRAVYTELNARLQAAALQLGSVTYLTEGESTATSSTQDSQVTRAWNLWLREIGR